MIPPKDLAAAALARGRAALADRQGLHGLRRAVATLSELVAEVALEEVEEVELVELAEDLEAKEAELLAEEVRDLDASHGWDARFWLCENNADGEYFSVWARSYSAAAAEAAAEEAGELGLVDVRVWELPSSTTDVSEVEDLDDLDDLAGEVEALRREEPVSIWNRACSRCGDQRASGMIDWLSGPMCLLCAKDRGLLD